MPVIYNCSVCRKRLSISRRKIGQQIECPFCSSYTEVPSENQSSPPTIEFQEAEAPPPERGRTLQAATSSFAGQSESDETRVPQESDTPPDGPILTAAPTVDQVRPLKRTGGKVSSPVPGREPEAPLRIRRMAGELEEMDLTPMVDVTFLLLIFFMITASFTLEKTIPTPVPDPNEQSASQPIQQQEDLLEKSILIGIESDNTITIDDEPLQNASLLRKRLTDLMLQEQKAEVLVTVADLAMQETVVYVLDTANDLGMQRIRLAAEPGDAE